MLLLVEVPLFVIDKAEFASACSSAASLTANFIMASFGIAHMNACRAGSNTSSTNMCLAELLADG
jgi:hypothetical protein